MKFLNSLALTILAGSLSTTALHADAKFCGNVGYKLNHGALEIHADRVANKSFEGRSGTLQVQVFATPYRYTGVEQAGTVLGSVSLRALYPGNEYRDLCQWTSYRAPEYTGCYYLTVALLEYRPCGYVVVDYVSMPGKVDLVGTCPAPVRVAAPRCEPVCVPRDVSCARPVPVTVYREPAPVYRNGGYSGGGYGVPAYRNYPARDYSTRTYIPAGNMYSQCSGR